MSKTPQIPLPLGFARHTLASYISGECNQAAIDLVLGWPSWRTPVVYVHGPAACGKTHLARVWAEDRADATVIAAEEIGARSLAGLLKVGRLAVDGIERLASEEALFHIADDVMIMGGSLLLTGRQAPGALSLALPDLKTRLVAATAVEITAPDEKFLGQLLLRLAEEVQIAMDPALAAFCVSRMERTHLAAVNLIAALDQRSLAAGKGVSRDMAAAVLDELARP